MQRVDVRQRRHGAVGVVVIQSRVRTLVNRVSRVRSVRLGGERRPGLGAHHRAGAPRVPVRARVVRALLAPHAHGRLGRFAQALTVRAALLRATYHGHHVE